MIDWNNKQTNPATYFFGWLPQDTYNGAVTLVVPSVEVPYIGGVAAFGEDNPTYGRIEFAHEFAHWLRRPHTFVDHPIKPCESPDAPSLGYWHDWPYQNAEIQVWGLNVSQNLNPSTTYDIMSYCVTDPMWISPFNYNQLFEQAFNPIVSTIDYTTVTTQEVFSISGEISTDDSVIFDPIWVSKNSMPIEYPSSGTQYCLETRTIDDTPITSYCFDLRFQDQFGKPTAIDMFYITLPYTNDAQKIVLRKGTTWIKTLERSSHPPEIKLTYPNGGESFGTNQAVTISWSANDPDNNQLFYTVLYSKDGINWLPIASNIKTTQLSVNLGELPGGSAAKFKVIASDSFNTSSDESDLSFSVGEKSPSAIILPFESAAISPNNPLILEGYAYDLEDHLLDNSALSWLSNKDGNLGTGGLIISNLSPGWQTITLQAIDHDGNVGKASKILYVGYQTFLPSIQRK